LAGFLNFKIVMAGFQHKLFFRLILKNREIYFLKILSLAIAFACSTLVTLFSINEFGYDRFHTKANQIFRILQRNDDPAYEWNRLSAKIPASAFNNWNAPTDSLVLARVKILKNVTLATESNLSREQTLHAVDTQLTRIFSFEMISGSETTFENSNASVMIAASIAEQWFGTTQAVGKSLKVFTSGDTVQLTVAAVFKDFPPNSHENFSFFIRYDSINLKSLRFDSDAGVYGRSFTGQFPNAMFHSQRQFLSYKAQPLSEIYFGPRVLGENATHGDSYSVLILICITSLILFLALTSFINLTTLTLPHRSKELAIKKLAGTNQLNLLQGFAAESFSIVGISLVLGIAIILLVANIIEPILSINLIALFLAADATLIVVLLSLAIILGAAPLFMTLRFTRATPNRLLSTEVITFPRFKRMIAVLQLGVSIFLIVSSVVIRRQVTYSLLKEPGRNHEQVVYLRYPKDLTNYDLNKLREGWKKYNANIVDVMATSQLPDRISSKEINSPLYFLSVDATFREFFKLTMKSGNWFRPNDGDSLVVVNELAHSLGRLNQATVIGVMDDMSQQFNQPQLPIKINLATNHINYNFLCVRILEVDIRRTVDYLSRTFATAQGPAQVSFLDRHFESWLNYQDRLNTMSEILAIISVLLSCCAIYGLSISLVRDKLKQIAVHKICGASSFHISWLLARHFIKQLALAVLIFGPISYIFLSELLRTFTYTTPFQLLDPVFPLAYCVFVVVLLCAVQAATLNQTDLTESLKR
jgi:putative ABC transport system permease protein